MQRLITFTVLCLFSSSLLAQQENLSGLTKPDGTAPEAVECCGDEYRFRQLMKSKGGVQQAAEEYADSVHAKFGKQVMRYGTPVEDMYSFISGEDFDGYEVSRAEAGAWMAASFFPFARIGKLGKFAKVATRNGDEILEISVDASTAFREAVEGGKHSGLLENILKQEMSVEQIEKSIDTYMNGKRGIKTHKDKIANPSKYVENWDDLRQTHQESLINGWKGEIQNAYEKIDILTDLLKK